MQICFSDETNLSFNKNLEFFIYGGLVVDESEFGSLARKVLDVKKYFKISDERPIKWPNVQWKGQSPLDPTVHLNVKNEFLNIVEDSNLKVIICLSPHLFSHKYKVVGTEVKFVIDIEKQKRTQTYTLELFLQKFNLFLQEQNALGLIISDHFGSLHTFVKEHSYSLFSNGTSYSKLENICYPLIQLENEFSPLHQLNDVLLGAISYSFGTKNFLPRFKKNFWSKNREILNRGITIYPIHPKSIALANDIDELKTQFNTLINAI